MENLLETEKLYEWIDRFLPSYLYSVLGEKNRGFAFVEYTSHRAAAMARRKLIPGRITLFGYEVAVDWADPESDVGLFESQCRVFC